MSKISLSLRLWWRLLFDLTLQNVTTIVSPSLIGTGLLPVLITSVSDPYYFDTAPVPAPAPANKRGSGNPAFLILGCRWLLFWYWAVADFYSNTRLPQTRYLLFCYWAATDYHSVWYWISTNYYSDTSTGFSLTTMLLLGCHWLLCW